MRLLSTDTFEVKEFSDDEVPRYAVLSHTWGEEEVSFQDMEDPRSMDKKGYVKIRCCCFLAKADGFDYVWIDTCCIDKTSSAELSEAINSMYRWYQEAEVCYAYLADVSSEAEFAGSRWFTRGWTLQELIAPSTVRFLNNQWIELGTRASLRGYISEATGIPLGILSGDDDLEAFSIAQRMSWAAKRKTSRVEDRAYCLLGIFGINMPLIYGERETAFLRLQEEIIKVSDDQSLFAWKSDDNRGGILATSPAAFISSNNVVQFNPFDTLNSPPTISSRGVHLELRFVGTAVRGLGLAILNCKENDGKNRAVAIYVRDLDLTMERFERVRCGDFERLDPRVFRPSQYSARRICVQKGRITHSRKPKCTAEPNDTGPSIHSDTLLQMNVGQRGAILRAAREGVEGFVWQLLTRSDTEVNLQDHDGWTPLSLAAKAGHESVVKVLLARRDIKADLKDINGRTPLSLVADIGNFSIAKRLLKSGKVDVNSRDPSGRTPLSFAAEKGHEAVVTLLLEYDANPGPKDESYRTPLSYAAEGGYTAIVQRLLFWGAEVDAKDRAGQTPLSHAAEKGHEAVVSLLVKHRADIDSKDFSGRTPLWHAAESSHVALVSLVLELGADPDSTDFSGRTSLSHAAERGNEVIVSLLVESGADLDLKDYSGRTPLSYASKNGHEAVVELLREKCAKVDWKQNFIIQARRRRRTTFEAIK